MLRRVLWFVVCAVLGLGLLSLPAMAQGNGHRKGKNKHQQEQDGEDAGYSRGGVHIVFSSRDRDLIRDYYRDQYSNLPPGLAKRGGNLPPGLHKHLERDGTLPPGLQKRVQPFPYELESRLSPLPDG